MKKFFLKDFIKDKKIIIGLGNPGTLYQDTRHNIGSFFVQYICSKLSIKMLKQYKGLISKYKDIYFYIQQKNYMNNIGESILYIMSILNIKYYEILIVYDEIDLPLGKILYRGNRSGHNGHNGIKSIINALNKNFAKIKIGIGKPKNKNLISKYVLDVFNQEEKKILHSSMDEFLN